MKDSAEALLIDGSESSEPAAIFDAEWRRLSVSHSGVIDAVGRGAVADELRRSLTAMFSNLRWASIVGDTVDTSTACSLLGVSRQALHRRLNTGTLVGLPGESSTQWPAWQFERDTRGTGRIRAVVADVVGAFFDALGDDYSTHIVASWATASNADLNGLAPADWIVDGRADEAVLDAAHAAAFAEAQ